MSPSSPSDTQFNPLAVNYAQSTVHSSGPSLPVLIRLAAPTPRDVALDVATGTGHTALALAPNIKQVTGIDIAEKMLEQAKQLSAQQKIANAHFIIGSAEALPFDNATFDLVTSRHAPHHFHDLLQFLKEAKRVLRPNGRLVIADQISPSSNTQPWINEWERIRDPSHFRQSTPDQWKQLATEAGLKWMSDEYVRYRLEFDWWTRQVNASPETLNLLRNHAAKANAEERADYQLEFDATGSIIATHTPMMIARMEG
jgi:ubiquinone/menaquinone biosynthesis C-methylase UbiE